MTLTNVAALELADWRRRVAGLYAAVRADHDPERAHAHGGGLFLPLRDGTAGDTSYGGGRYALDTAKGADLGGTASTLVIDLNFLYHPSCRYSSRWQCPLAPAENTAAAPVRAGERLSHARRVSMPDQRKALPPRPVPSRSVT